MYWLHCLETPSISHRGQAEASSFAVDLDLIGFPQRKFLSLKKKTTSKQLVYFQIVSLLHLQLKNAKYPPAWRFLPLHNQLGSCWSAAPY